MQHALASALAIAALLTASAAGAAEGESSDWDGGYGESGKVRSDFTAGFGTALAFGRLVGYPNHAGQIGDPAYRANTGFGVGSQYSLWIGGALKDWFVFGVGMCSEGVQGKHLVGGSSGFLFRVETYPLFDRGGIFQDLGVQASFGIAGGLILDGKQTVADGGALSLLGVGLVYEAWHFGYFAAGPTLEYRHLFSESLYEDLGLLGMRIVFYSRP
jgi:hypothetical protein